MILLLHEKMDDMRSKKVLTILIVLVLVFIWGNSMLPGEISRAISDTVMDWMNRAAAALGLGEDLFTYMADQNGDGILDPTSHIIRKMAHVTEFAVLGALLWMRLESAGCKRAFTAFGLSVTAAGIDELIQRFFSRGSQLRDVAIDSDGAVLGIVLAVLIYTLHGRRKI